MGRCRQVRIADPHVDEIDAAGTGLALVLVDLREEVRGQLGQARGQRDLLLKQMNDKIKRF